MPQPLRLPANSSRFSLRTNGFEALESRLLLSATVLQVNTTADVVDSSDAFLSLREAVLAANASPGDEVIHLPAGHYGLTRRGAKDDFALTGDLDIRNSGSLQIIGAGRDQTMINAAPLIDSVNPEDRVFHVHGAVFEISGLTLTGGTASALYNEGGLVSITSSSIVDNSGSGIHNSYGPGLFDGRMIIHDSYIARNTAVAGGGISNHGPLIISDSTLEGNDATFQGGAIVGGQTSIVSMTNCTIIDNTAGQDAAALWNDGWFFMDRTRVIDNQAPGVSAVLSFGSTYISRSAFLGNSGGSTILSIGPGNVIANSLIANNSSDHDGAGIYGPFTVLNSTIVGNRANADGIGQGQGGGVFGPAVLRNTIVAGNVTGAVGNDVPSDVSGLPLASSEYNLIGDPASAGGLIEGTNGNLVGDGAGGLLALNSILELMPAENGGRTPSMALVPGSRAINSGNPLFEGQPEFDLSNWPHQHLAAPDLMPQFDQRGAGFPRVVGGRADIGSFEFGGSFAGEVVRRSIFYNHSAFDGGPNGSPQLDAFGVDSTKQALLPNDTLANSANITSYSRGINGLMVDLAGSHPNLSVEDFNFRVGANNDPASWAVAPMPSAIHVLGGQGAGGSDRVVITWPDGAIVNTYLQVIVAANADTGLAEPDFFFFGNRVGDSFSTQPAGSFSTTGIDELAARNAQLSWLELTATHPYDYNKSGTITAADQLIARANIGVLRRIQIGSAEATAPLVAGVANAMAATLKSSSKKPELISSRNEPVPPIKQAMLPSRSIDIALSLVEQAGIDPLVSYASDETSEAALAALAPILPELLRLV